MPSTETTRQAGCKPAWRPDRPAGSQPKPSLALGADQRRLSIFDLAPMLHRAICRALAGRWPSEPSCAGAPSSLPAPHRAGKVAGHAVRSAAPCKLPAAPPCRRRRLVALTLPPTAGVAAGPPLRRAMAAHASPQHHLLADAYIGEVHVEGAASGPLQVRRGVSAANEAWPCLLLLHYRSEHAMCRQ